MQPDDVSPTGDRPGCLAKRPAAHGRHDSLSAITTEQVEWPVRGPDVDRAGGERMLVAPPVTRRVGEHQDGASVARRDAQAVTVSTEMELAAVDLMEFQGREPRPRIARSRAG